MSNTGTALHPEYVPKTGQTHTAIPTSSQRFAVETSQAAYFIQAAAASYTHDTLSSPSMTAEAGLSATSSDLYRESGADLCCSGSSRHCTGCSSLALRERAVRSRSDRSRVSMITDPACEQSTLVGSTQLSCARKHSAAHHPAHLASILARPTAITFRRSG